MRWQERMAPMIGNSFLRRLGTTFCFDTAGEASSNYAIRTLVGRVQDPRRFHYAEVLKVEGRNCPCSECHSCGMSTVPRGCRRFSCGKMHGGARPPRFYLERNFLRNVPGELNIAAKFAERWTGDTAWSYEVRTIVGRCVYTWNDSNGPLVEIGIAY